MQRSALYHHVDTTEPTITAESVGRAPRGPAQSRARRRRLEMDALTSQRVIAARPRQATVPIILGVGLPEARRSGGRDFLENNSD